MPRMSVNLRGVDRDLVRRAKARAAKLGLTLKAWIVSLIQNALRDHDRPIDHRDTLSERVEDPESPPKGGS